MLMPQRVSRECGNHLAKKNAELLLVLPLTEAFLEIPRSISKKMTKDNNSADSIEDEEDERLNLTTAQKEHLRSCRIKVREPPLQDHFRDKIQSMDYIEQCNISDVAIDHLLE